MTALYIVTHVLVSSKELLLAHVFVRHGGPAVPLTQASNVQLLQLLAGSSHNSLNRRSDHEIRHLDTIAILLTTRRQRDVVAAAFDWRERRAKIKLILAKNDTPTTVDTHGAARSIDILNSPGCNDPRDVLPFLFSRYRLNINKRIQCLHVVMNRIQLGQNTREVS